MVDNLITKSRYFQIVLLNLASKKNEVCRGSVFRNAPQIATDEMQ